MRLAELLKGTYAGPLERNYKNLDIEAICSDSRKVKRNSLFVALPGANLNGVHFIEEAIQRGASVVATNDLNRCQTKNHVLVLPTADPSQFLRQITRNFFGNPSQRVRTIGVTGTNGKTTISYLLQSILQASGKKCGIIGTIHYKIGEKILSSHNTTPGLLDNQELLTEMAQEGMEYCVMEVSSHALDQNRVDLIDFKEAVFTNLTGDHLDYHKTLEHYFSAKAKLFTNLSPAAAAVINADDSYARELMAMTPAQVKTYGVRQAADLKAQDIHLDISGTQFALSYQDNKINFRTKLVGLYNVYNVLAAVGAALNEGIALKSIQKGIEDFNSVAGRLERVDVPRGFSVFIDYAHTHDALWNVLNTLKELCRGKIILVFGCGGDRDKTKRPLMGETACQLADFSIITSDNPRGEDPQAIIRDILPGFKKENYTVVVDRQQAIEKALTSAQKEDIVLLAGKGHETYQIFKNKTIPFDERKIVQGFFKC